MSKKTVYVPRSWEVSYTDANGVEQKNVVLRANCEYKINENGTERTVTIAGVRSEEGNAYLAVKVELEAGFMNVMKKIKDQRIWVKDIHDITPVRSTYVQTTRSLKNFKIDGQAFTFAFDTKNYNSKYRITIAKGEFVALAIKDPADPNKKSRSIYGHINDVDTEAGVIEFTRYVANKGVRDVYTQIVQLSDLLGIYRYVLEIGEKVDPVQSDAASEEVAVTSEEK